MNHSLLTFFSNLLLLNSILSSCGSDSENTEDPAHPNVLLILTDDQSFMDLGCFGSPDLHTPNIDRLAENGIRLTQFYAGAPVCSPSRAALLTGKYNFNAGLFGNVAPPHIDPEGKSGLPSEEITMAEVFKEAGYRTALIGKWHLGHTPEKLPNGQGFDYFFGHQRGCIDNYSHFFYWSGPNTHDLYQNEEEIYRHGQFFGDLMKEELIDFVGTPNSDPFFVYWAINMPHYPYQGKEKWLSYYKDMDTPRKEYASFISTFDELIGEVYAYLEESGKLENTIIAFQTDHGHSTEERAYFGGGDNGPFNGAKFSMLEGGLRIPAIISYPKKLATGEVRHQWSNSVDWLPTLAELAGVKVNHAIDGKSMLPFLREPKNPSSHEIMHWGTGDPETEKYPWAVRKGDWKLLGNPRDPTGNLEFGENDNLYLVNLSQDSTESSNMANQHPEIVRELSSLQADWIKKIVENRKDSN
ncbi:sulfatase-like hydrolase/transferase [Pleomorphovibrio marinus]|uniref:sulfatase-like hydrolase/transferase n=1 Tax=Pleomorphovibrio marinus TaxID=2164132 RepID=UPI000E0C948D|nr:sulfatase-like hydrolase/transferase [Pleomorphovibrio marinus]